MSNDFRFVFLPAAGICPTLFINEREIPTNGVLDVCYQDLGERQFVPFQHMEMLVHITLYRCSIAEKSRQLYYRTFGSTNMFLKWW